MVVSAELAENGCRFVNLADISTPMAEERNAENYRLRDERGIVTMRSIPVAPVEYSDSVLPYIGK